ncbi:hypothetical protein AB0J80_17370 [Actinoplanes sp. NPDC049548]|uniref:hypothetical protein n=1 Tax=Actinoplanes sp. NPDC049548 TaxID=3155152 RepID=UPI00342C30F2
MDADVMVGFGGKQAWLAVRDCDPAEVLAALGLRDLGEVRWRDGIDLAHLTDDRVAVTPPLPGSRWVLAAGRYLLRPDVALDLAALSKQLHTEVQYFATHRVTETHRWQRADDGSLIRAFGYVGQTGDVTTWYGDPDPVERAIGLPATLPGSLDDELDRLLESGGSAAGPTTVLVNEQDVLRVAAGWSVDPTELDGREAPGPLRVGAAV